MRQSTIAQRAFAQSLAELGENAARGDFERAITICDFLSINYPGAVRVFRARAHALERLGDVARALDDYRHVLDTVPTDYRSMIGAARCLQLLGEEAEAQELAAQVLDYDAENHAAQALAGKTDFAYTDADVQTAHKLFQGGSTDRALKLIRKKLARMPDRVDLQLVLADFLWHSNRRVEAIELCNSVLYEKADALSAHALLAYAWRAAGADGLADLHKLHLAQLDPDASERAEHWPNQLEAQVAFPPSADAAPVSHDAFLLDTAPEPRPQLVQAPASDGSDGVEGDDAFKSDEASDEEPQAPAAYMSAERELNLKSPAPLANSDDADHAAWVDSLISSRGNADLEAELDELDALLPLDDSEVLPVKRLAWSPPTGKVHPSDSAESNFQQVDSGADIADELATPHVKPTAAPGISDPESLPSAHEPNPILFDSSLLTPDLLDAVAGIDATPSVSTNVPSWIARITGRVADPNVELKRASWPEAQTPPPAPMIHAQESAKRAARLLPDEELKQARAAIGAGDLELAEKHYRKLVKRAVLLNEVVHDLTDARRSNKSSRALQRVLGDAYMRLGDTNNALAAYNEIMEQPAQKFRFKPMGNARARKPRA